PPYRVGSQTAPGFRRWFRRPGPVRTPAGGSRATFRADQYVYFLTDPEGEPSVSLLRPGRREYDEDFVAYYLARAGRLRRTAYLLCGNWHLAEDLAQVTFTKLYQAWRRIERPDVMDQYAHRVLLRAFLAERR